MRRKPGTFLLATLTIAWLALAGCKCGLDRDDGAGAAGSGNEPASGGEQQSRQEPQGEQGKSASGGTQGPARPARLPHPDLEAADAERAERPWGDLDGNGLADPVVGFQGAPPNPAHRSRIFRSTRDVTETDPMQRLPGGGPGDANDVLRRVGDLDGDGRPDLAIGNGMRNVLRVYLGADGGPSDDPAITLRPPSDDGHAFFGHDLAVGDLDGDGHRDLVVGADEVGEHPARAFVYAGTPEGPSAQPRRSIESPGDAGGRFAVELVASDLDGDGADDLLVGEPRADERRGRVHVYPGGPEGLPDRPSASLKAPDGPDDPQETYWELGERMAAAGDVAEPDGCTVVVAAVGISHSSAYVLRADAQGEPTLAPLAPPPELPIRAVAAGDVTGDGRVDIAVSTLGAVRLHVAGDEGVPAEPTTVLEAPETASRSYGADVAVMGDANGDGRSELLVGASGSKDATGAAYVYYGTGEGVHDPPSRLWWRVRAHERFGGWVE